MACYNEYDSLIFHAHSYNDTHTKKQVDETCVHKVVETTQQIDNGSPYGYVTFIEKKLLRLSGFETINMKDQRNKREEIAAWHYDKYGF